MVRSVYCEVIGQYVTCLTKVGGGLADVTCPDYDEATGLCRLKREALEAGRLSVRLDATSEGASHLAGGPECSLV